MAFAFFAYPSAPPYHAESLRDAARLASSKNLKIEPWELGLSLGIKIDDNLEAKIAECDFLVADITHPNFNVFYEIGFAIAKSKPVFLLSTPRLSTHAREY
jgi:nucleoside 2-deoxyribosyltransferase